MKSSGPLVLRVRPGRLQDQSTAKVTRTTHDYAGLIAVAGFLAAFALSKLAG